MAAKGEQYFLAVPPNPRPHVSTGLAFTTACAHHVENTFKASRVYMIVSKSISGTENFVSLEKALSGKVVGVRRGIRQHVPWDDVVEVAKDVHDRDADLIVTLGAGSLTDGAKVVSLAVANNAFTVEDLGTFSTDENPKDVKPCTIPIINIPTSLSGGEYSINGGATDLRTHRKHSFNYPSMGCSLVILDPALSISTPEYVWLQSGVRAVDHCVEGLCSMSPKANEESDSVCEKGLRLLVPNLLVTKNNPGNEEARLNEMLGVIEAMRGHKFGVPMGASHGIGHQLGPLGVGHGETSCVMLPSVMEYNYQHGDEGVRKRQQKILDILWSEPTVANMLEGNGIEKGTSNAGDLIAAIVKELGMPGSLEEVGIGPDKLDMLAENSMHDRWIPTNPVPMTDKSQVLEVLNMALKPRASQGGHACHH
ncbi:Dehydroquinate synthase-like protein [Rhizodiscina lignyota]|uniref:Dehydroquinate synthase-like protein n=1 Tax=Rhizodiscina lignyota TaxID=1504668 RepID=A0A9P4IDR5_9PEZI|nr:Dehydroquinate synthase-like protein [Rhizodiscina lignyota]